MTEEQRRGVGRSPKCPGKAQRVGYRLHRDAVARIKALGLAHGLSQARVIDAVFLSPDLELGDVLAEEKERGDTEGEVRS